MHTDPDCHRGIHSRSSKSGRKTYARMVRSITGPRATPPPEIVKEFKEGKTPKGQLFSNWMAHDGDWLEVAYTLKLKRRTVDSSRNVHRLMTKVEIQEKFKNQSPKQSPCVCVT